MAIVDAVATGNWSNFSVTFGGIEPQPGDIVKTGNNIITIDQSIQVERIEATGNGQFLVLQAGVDAEGGELVIDADYEMGSSVTNTGGLRLQHSSGIVRLTGRQTHAYIVASSRPAVVNESTGEFILAECNGGWNPVNALNSASPGVRNLVGGIIRTIISKGVLSQAGGDARFGSGIYNVGSGIVYCVQAIGGRADVNLQADNPGIYNSSSGDVYVTEVLGGPTAGRRGSGIWNAGSGRIYANIAKGSFGTGAGIFNSGAGTVECDTAEGSQSSTSPGIITDGGIARVDKAVSNVGPAVVTTAPGRTIVRELDYNLGVSAATGPLEFAEDETSLIKAKNESGDTVVFADTSTFADPPAESDVRFGVPYLLGSRTGNCHVPPKESVGFGVPVDDGVGEAVLTQAGVQNSVRTELATELSRIDETVSSRLASSSYTTPPTPNQIMGGLVTGSQPPGSLARFIRDIKQADVLFEGQIITATSDTAELNGDATTVCVGQLITIGEEGDIERQSRFITAFDPGTKIVTLDQPWCVVPDDGANYQIKTQRNALIGRLTGAIANTFGGLLANLATMIEDVSGWRWTAKALEEGSAGGGGDCGDGDRQIQVAAIDGTDGVRGVKVTVVGTTLFAFTNTSGEAFLNVDDMATYTLRFSAPANYEPVADQQVEVELVDVPVLIELTPRTLPAPPSPATASLSVAVCNQGGTPLEGIAVEAKIPPGKNVNGPLMALNVVLSALTDSSGMASLIVLREQEYELWFTREKGERSKVRIMTTNLPTQTFEQVYQG